MNTHQLEDKTIKQDQLFAISEDGQVLSVRIEGDSVRVTTSGRVTLTANHANELIDWLIDYVPGVARTEAA